MCIPRRSCLLASILTLSVEPALAAADFAAPVFHTTGTGVQEGVAIGDIDGDGDNDLAVLHRDGSLVTLDNLGSGSFAPRVDHGVLWPEDSPADLVMADVDRDGDTDLLVSVVTMSGALSILKNRGDGTFDPPVDYETCYSTQMIVAADLDGDWRVDVAGDSNCFRATIMLNDGNGTFRHNGEYGNGYTPGGIDAADLDGDGDRDVAYGNGTSDVTVLRNDGTGAFGPHTSHDTGDNPQDLELHDVDGDGDRDILTSNHYGTFLSVHRNIGAGFAPVVNYFPGDGTENMAVADFDLDSDLDVAVANRDHDHVSILHNAGNGTFGGRHDETAGNGPEDISHGDLDGDARADLAVAHWESNRVAVYRNITAVGPDADQDGVHDSVDCAPANRSAWSAPAAVSDLLMDGGAATRASWSAPAATGTSVPVYDLLRSTDPGDWSAAVCIEANEIDRVTTDDETPDGLFVYLVQVRNACGANAGRASNGTPHPVVTCP